MSGPSRRTDTLPERPEIRSSWQRTRDSGLAPDSRVDPEKTEPFDESSRLRRAAAPVLDELAAALDDSRFTLILADQHALLVDIRYGRDTLRPALDEVGAVVGRRFTEAATGASTATSRTPAAPFGGVKDSGIGRELGPEGLAAYRVLKSVYC